jgi:hypothetical protein
MLYLGFYIDTCLMIMAWPVNKWLALAAMIDNFLARDPCILSPLECSSLLGLIRNAASVAPLGVFYSLQIQHALNAGVRGLETAQGPTPPVLETLVL